MYHIIIDFLLVVEVLVSLLIVLLVLMQRPKSEGLGASFGTGMTDNLFGAQTTNVLQKATRVLGGAFFAVALLLSMLYSKTALAEKQSQIQQQLANAPQPKPVNVVDVPVDADIAKMTPDQLKEYLIKKAAAQGVPVTGGTAASGTAASGTTSGTNATHPKTGDTPASSSPDVEAPSLQLGVPVSGGAGDGKFQLQTGSAASDPFQTGTGAKRDNR